MKKTTEKKPGNPIHPGELLADELEYIGMTAAVLAVKIGVPKNRMYEIINEQRGMTADTAMRLGVFFGTGPNIWLNHQKSYELDVARQKIGDGLKHIKPYDKNAARQHRLACPCKNISQNGAHTPQRDFKTNIVTPPLPAPC